MEQNKILKILDLPEETESEVRKVLGGKFNFKTSYSGSAPDFPICKRTPIRRLAAIVCLLCEKYEEYKALGVPDEIIRNTFRDVTLRAELYFSKTGKAGLSADDALWFRHIMNCAIFKVGVLQFQPFGMIYLDEEFLGEPYMEFSPEQKLRLPSGAHVINCHIQQGANLSTESVKQSFADAHALFEQIFPQKKFGAFVGYSWLLYPDMTSLLPSESRIRSFAENFEIISKVQDSEQAFEYLFGKAYKRPPKIENPTFLQKLAKENPKAFGFACGIKYL